jgi:hypothetical protein
MAERTILHIGTMKSATTYVQGACEANADNLAEARIRWPGAKLNFQAIDDLLGDAPPDGHWRRLRRAVARERGTVLVSNELISIRKFAAARKIVKRLGTPIDVIITARDLARVVPSQYATGQKRGHSIAWSDFIAALVADDREEQDVRWFWRRQDLPAIIDRWAPLAASITLVTVPPPGSALEVVTDRFAEALGCDPAVFSRPSTKSPLVQVHPRLTDAERGWAHARSTALVESLHSRDIRVIGSLSDLLSSPPQTPAMPVALQSH